METEVKAPGRGITKQNIFNFLKEALILVLAAAILLTTSRILTLKSEDGISQFKSFYKQPEGSVDLLFMGSSKTYCCISTGIMWEEYGISSFDLGGAEAPTWSTYYQMKEALKYQHPKVMAVELSTAALRPTLEPPVFWIEDNDYGMKWNSNRVDLLKANTSGNTLKSLMFPLSTMHGRYNELTADDFIDKNNSVNYKGYDSRQTITEFETPDVSYVDWEGEISDKSREYLYKIIDLCRENDVTLWFFITPYYIEENDQAIYNYYERICSEEDIPFINFSDPEHIKAMEFDYSKDLADSFHVNIQGSEKFTKYLGGILKDTYDLPDHRGDAYYSSWDVDAQTLRMERADYDLGIAESDAEWIDTLDEDNYLIFAAAGPGVSADAIPDDILSSLEKLGITASELTGGNAIIVNSNQITFSQNEENFDTSMKNGYDSLWFRRSASEDENKAFDTKLNVNSDEYDFADEGIEIYAYDRSNCVMAGSRQILCGQ